MPRAINLTGMKFGKLTVINFSGHRGNKKTWMCACDCGTKIDALGESLRSGNSTSCGCKRTASLIKRNKESAIYSGSVHTPSGMSWRAMMERCYYAKHEGYGRYGKRGIKVCEFLRGGPNNLISIIGERPPKLTLDRKNNNHGYNCGLCAECLQRKSVCNIRWATIKEQNRNSRRNTLITYKGETHCVSEWAEIFNIRKSVVWSRVKRGWKMPRLFESTK